MNEYIEIWWKAFQMSHRHFKPDSKLNLLFFLASVSSYNFCLWIVPSSLPALKKTIWDLPLDSMLSVTLNSNLEPKSFWSYLLISPIYSYCKGYCHCLCLGHRSFPSDFSNMHSLNQCYCFQSCLLQSILDAARKWYLWNAVYHTILLLQLFSCFSLWSNPHFLLWNEGLMWLAYSLCPPLQVSSYHLR